ncbi:MAG: cobalamin biosynthesis protein CbiG [Proteobacteria bacterium]|nr:cobalamin biosynthesis protein CbiG [Pseudomonadota bacterium]
MAVFEAYVMVDWSAANRPRQGADSIWICVLAGDAPLQRVNPPTGHAAVLWLQKTLTHLLRRPGRILVGFDFPLGYPAGFAKRLGLSGPPWRALWSQIADRIEDHADNRNNRFEVAAALNRRLSGDAFPFWGHHPAHGFAGLGRFRPGGYGDGGLAEMRLTDSWITGPQPVWKLFGAGSVGGQALTGIPCVRRLRQHPRLAPVTRIWPFETGLKGLDEGAHGWRILLAEVYPSIVAAKPEPGHYWLPRRGVLLNFHVRCGDSWFDIEFRGPNLGL